MKKYLLLQLSCCWFPSLALALVSFLLLVPLASAQNTFTPGLNVAAVQSALNNAAPGDIVQLVAGELDLSSSTLTIPQAGITLRGAGPASTTIKSAVNGLPYLLQVTGPPHTTPTVIEGITFLNSAVDPLNSLTAVGPEAAIQVLVSGPAGGQPSLLKSCEFLNFITPQIFNSQPSAVYFLGVSNWRIEGNRFNGLTRGLYMISGGSMVITGNIFTR